MAVIHIISLFLFFLSPICLPPISFFFFFNDTATTEIYTLSLHDALPIWSTSPNGATSNAPHAPHLAAARVGTPGWFQDRKSTRLNSSHGYISYAVFCLKKKKKNKKVQIRTDHPESQDCSRHLTRHETGAR